MNTVKDIISHALELLDYDDSKVVGYKEMNNYYDNTEIEEWFNKIDFTPIFKRVEDLLGMKLTFTVKLILGYRSKIYDRLSVL
mgnify:CR=1 FL=1